MPNWCEGTLKIRGTVKQIMLFAIHAFETADIRVGDCSDTYINILFNNDAWVKGTHRAFCNGEICFGVNDANQKVAVALEFRQAWNVKAEPFLELARKANVDIKIYAFERGLQFNRDIEIINGELIKNETIEFDDYDWDCICPLLGG